VLTLYDILGVTPDATQEDITASFRRRSMRCHPDRVPGRDEEFKRLNAAYAVLRNPLSRAAYDRELTGRTLAGSRFLGRWRRRLPRLGANGSGTAGQASPGLRIARAIAVALTVALVATAVYLLHRDATRSAARSGLPDPSVTVAATAPFDVSVRAADAGRTEPDAATGAAVERALATVFDDTLPDDDAVFRWRPQRREGGGQAPLHHATRIGEFAWSGPEGRQRAIVFGSLPDYAAREWCGSCEVVVGVVLLRHDGPRVVVSDHRLDLGSFGEGGAFDGGNVRLVDVGGGRRALELTDPSSAGAPKGARVDIVGLFDGRIRRIGQVALPGPRASDQRGCTVAARGERCVPADGIVLQFEPDPDRDLSALSIRRVSAGGASRTTEIDRYVWDGSGYVRAARSASTKRTEPAGRETGSRVARPPTVGAVPTDGRREFPPP
jgi:hypothetical protein